MDFKKAGIRQYLSMAWRNLWTLLVPATAGFILAGVWALIAPDVFRADVVIAQRLASASDEYTSRASQNSSRQLMRQVKDLMLRHESLALIIKDFGLYPDVLEDKGMTIAVRDFRKDIAFVGNGKTGTITVSYQTSQGDNPARLCKVVAQELVDRFNDEQKKRLTEDGRFLSVHLNSAVNDAMEDEKRYYKELQRFRLQHVLCLPEDVQYNRDAIQNARDLIASEDSRTERNRMRIEDLRMEEFSAQQYLDRMKDNLGGDRELRTLDEHIATTRRNLRAAEDRYTKGSDQIKAIETRLEQLNKEREELILRRRQEFLDENPQAGMYITMLKSIRRRIKLLEQENAETDERVQKYERRIKEAEERIRLSAELGEKLSVLQRSLEDAQGRRLHAQQRERNVDFREKLKGNKDTAPNPIAVLQPAVEPTRPMAPHRMSISLMGLAAGLALGVALAFLKERGDNGFRTKDELRTLLPGAIIVTVPNIEPASARALRILSRAVGACMLFATATVMLGLIGIRMEWWGDISLIQPLLDWTKSLLRL